MTESRGTACLAGRPAGYGSLLYAPPPQVATSAPPPRARKVQKLKGIRPYNCPYLPVLEDDFISLAGEQCIVIQLAESSIGYRM